MVYVRWLTDGPSHWPEIKFYTLLWYDILPSLTGNNIFANELGVIISDVKPVKVSNHTKPVIKPPNIRS